MDDNNKGLNKAINLKLEIEAPKYDLIMPKVNYNLCFNSNVSERLDAILLSMSKVSDVMYEKFVKPMNEISDRMGEFLQKHSNILKDIDFDELYRRADSAMYKSKNNTGYCATLECVTKTF